MAAAAAVLLIACANLASLLLSRAAGRRGELAVRAALGATRGRLVRQLVVEGVLLSLTRRPARARARADRPRSDRDSDADRRRRVERTSTLDPRLLAFTFALAIATGLVFSVAPALHAGRASLQDALHQQSRSAVGAGNRLTRDTLVVLQIAAARRPARGHRPDDPDARQSARHRHRLPAGPDADDAHDAAEPEVRGATAAARVLRARPCRRQDPARRRTRGLRVHAAVHRAQGNTSSFRIEGRQFGPDQLNDALFRSGTTDYLSLLDVRLIEGRLIDERDGADAPRVVVINETLARQFFPNESPLGHRMNFSRETNPFYTIVGVVHDVRERGYEPSLKPGVYLSIAQAPEVWAIPEYLVLRTRGNPEDLAESARRVIAGVDPAQPVMEVRSMDAILDLQVADRQQQMVLLGAFAGLALVLASLGLYGLLAYAVAQRGREIGLRIALGATPREVVTMVAVRGLALAGVGLALGVAGGWAATRTMSSVLYGVRANDPLTFAGAVALLGGVALVASIVPAARAARVDPMVVLRQNPDVRSAGLSAPRSRP